MPRYQTYRRYLRDRFGVPVLKVPINGGFSCPNRDGTKSTHGCSFCDNRSFSPVAFSEVDPASQLRRTISRVGKKFSAFLPYLQPFSNTYAEAGRLRQTYESLLSVEGVVGLAIGTRPDCLPRPVLDLLGELSQKTYISIELGLQSASDCTLRTVNRGHTFADFSDAVRELADRNIETVAHVMLGLPGETETTMYRTAERLSELPVHGVKIHQLMVIADTPLQAEYQNGKVVLLALEQYADLLAGFLSRLRPDQVIHRLMADSRPEHGLIAPMWSSDKQAALAVINRRLEDGP